MMDLLADAMNILKVHKRAGKYECKVPASKQVKVVLQVLQKEGYVKEFEFFDDGKSGYFVVRGIGPINNCGVIKPRFSVKKDGVASWEKRYLPSKDFGILILTTTKGVVTNREIKGMDSGGRLMAYCY